MKKECKSTGAICKTEWAVSHKAYADGTRVEIIVYFGEKLEIGIMSIPAIKATLATIEAIEQKVCEAFQLLHSDSNVKQEDPWVLRVGTNENTGAQEVYLSRNNGQRQLVVSSADFRKYDDLSLEEMYFLIHGSGKIEA